MRLCVVISFLCFLLSCGNTGAPDTSASVTAEQEDSLTTLNTIEIDSNCLYYIEADSLKGIQFSVDNVAKNTSLLPTYDAEKVVANFIGKNLTFSPEDTTSLKLIPIQGNGLINTLNICYGQHRPIVLSPDIIWMTIAQGISTHINQNFNALEEKIFAASKPKKIVVRNDSLEFGSKHWQSLVSDLSDSTKKYTKQNMYSFMVPQFTTTTQNIHTAYESNLLYAYKKAFTYVGESGCGIPYITLTGEKADWIELRNQLNGLDELNLKYWRLELEPLLDEFIAVYDNDINLLFWKNIYKEFHDYGPFNVSGWILKFYPYLEVIGEGEYDESTDMMKLEHQFIKNEYLTGDRYLISDLVIDDFPNYKSEVEIIWKNHFKNETSKMYLYSGIMGARQYNDGSLKPWISWAICAESEPNSNKLSIPNVEMDHRNPDWTPHVYKITTVGRPAIYSTGKYLEFDPKYSLFKKELGDFLTSTKSTNFENDTLTLIILANGKPLIKKYSGSEETKLKIESWLRDKGIKWAPAIMPLTNVLMMDVPEDLTGDIPVNSEITITLNSK